MIFKTLDISILRKDAQINGLHGEPSYCTVADVCYMHSVHKAVLLRTPKDGHSPIWAS